MRDQMKNHETKLKITRSHLHDNHGAEIKETAYYTVVLGVTIDGLEEPQTITLHSASKFSSTVMIDFLEKKLKEVFG